MAATKAVTAIFSAEDFTTGGHADSSAINLDDGYGAQLGVKVTNGATGPTVALSLQIEVSQDGTEYYNFGGPLASATGNSIVTSWSIDIPIGVEYVKLSESVTPTGQTVVVDSDISEVTAVS